VKEVVGPLNDGENQLVSNNEVMCEILNSYFGSVFTSENVDDLPKVRNMFEEEKNHMLNNIEITQDIISSNLSKLKINRAPSVDRLVPRILVKNADILSIPLLYIYIYYRKSLESA